MKKIILLFAALAATVTCAFAGTESAASLSKTHYNYRDFSMLSISSAFHVELTFTDTYSVDVEVPDFLEPYLKVTCLAGKLRIGLANVPKDIQRKLNNQHDQLHAWVSMPNLQALSMSGATRLSTTGVPALARNQSLSIEMSGASVLENLEAGSNDRMTIDLSGASKATLKADFPVLDIELSGASKLKLTGDAEKMAVDCSGASNCQFTGDYQSLRSEISGSSRMDVSGDVRTMVVDCSGSSKVEIDGIVEKAEVELSGVSKATLSVKERLDYELSGVSTLRFRDLGASVRGEISRGSKIEYMK